MEEWAGGTVYPCLIINLLDPPGPKGAEGRVAINCLSSSSQYNLLITFLTPEPSAESRGGTEFWQQL